jgi:hypothetical protein
MDARLPSPALFNHVLVRANIGGAIHYLDGTRLGDRYLDRLPPPPFRWALPLRKDGGALEPVKTNPLVRPAAIAVIDIDARAGFDKPAKVTAEHVLRHDEAYAVQARLVAMAAEDANRALRGYWGKEMAWVDADKVAWRYDERHATLLLPMAGFFAPDLLKRPREQDQTAPWAVRFPRFQCYATSLRLPPPDPKYRWTYDAEPVDRTIGGTAYWRASGMRDGVVRTVMSSRNLMPEISAADAKAANDAVTGFNSNMSSVDEVPGNAKADAGSARSSLPFGDDADWSWDVPICQRPTK